MPTVTGPVTFLGMRVTYATRPMILVRDYNSRELFLSVGPWIRLSSELPATGPALKLTRTAAWVWRWYAESGSRSIKAKVYCPRQDYRPQLKVYSHPSMASPTTYVVTAPADTDWVWFPTISFTMTQPGILTVEICNRAYYPVTRVWHDPTQDYCLIDSLTVT